MNLDYLKQLVTIKHSCSLSAAAKSLYVSQSVLSRNMKQLEAELGCELFLRTKNSIHLTDLGLYLSEGAEKLIIDYEKLIHDFHEKIDKKTPIIQKK